MAFWTTDIGGAASGMELKQKYNFLLKFQNEIVITVKSADLPKASIETKEFKLINHFYKYPGVVKWEPISITLVDTYTSEKKPAEEESATINGMIDASREAWNFLMKSGYRPPSNANDIKPNDGYENLTTPVKEFFKGRVFGTKDGEDGKVILERLNHSGIAIETWELYNPIVTKIDWGSLQYGEDTPVEITLSIDYDYAVLK